MSARPPKYSDAGTEDRPVVTDNWWTLPGVVKNGLYHVHHSLTGECLKNSFGDTATCQVTIPLYIEYVHPDQAPAQSPEVLTYTQEQFWRESEQRWLDRAVRIFHGKHKDFPTRWRHRTVTKTTTYGEWQKGSA